METRGCAILFFFFFAPMKNEFQICQPSSSVRFSWRESFETGRTKPSSDPAQSKTLLRLAAVRKTAQNTPPNAANQRHGVIPQLTPT